MPISKQQRHYPKELSWLLFNERVLQEAEDKRIPFVERIKFLAIFSSNQDEFYRVRVANLQRHLRREGASAQMEGWKVSEILKRIREKVMLQSERFHAAYSQLLLEMEKVGVRILNAKELDASHESWLANFFQNEVRPRLVPMMLRSAGDVPALREQFIYLAVMLENIQGQRGARYYLIEIPTDILPRFVVLPSKTKQSNILLLEDVVQWGLKSIFATLEPETIGAWTIKVSRDAEIALEDEFSQSFVDKLTQGLKRREQGAPVRMVYDSALPESFLRILRRRLGLRNADSLIPGSRTHNFRDFIKFPHFGRKELVHPPFVSQVHPAFQGNGSLFPIIAKQDHLLHFPYHSFNSFVDLLREAAIDPHVSDIQMTVYRASTNSSVLNALVNAARNGKRVTVLLEVMARFDEENNLAWAERLDEEDVKVIFGVRGLKVHSKLCLITRKENGKSVQYATLGTGNFNETTARLYTDHTLFTANRKITQEVQAVFDFFRNNYKVPRFDRLLVAPFNGRSGIIQLIDREIHNARKGHAASIYLKLNNFSDPEMEEKIYEAGKAGVQVRLIIRSMFSLVPGIEKFSEGIEAISIVGRFLEHSRFLIVGNRGDTEVFLSSSDWMTRNLDGRVEVTCPVLDKKLKKELVDYFDLQWKDTDKARVVDSSFQNQIRISKVKRNAQNEIPQWLQHKETRT